MRLPSYRLHKRSGRAVVQYRPFFGTSPHYLKGLYNSPESRLEYEQIRARIAAHIILKTPAPKRSSDELCIADLLVEYFRFAMTHYSGRGASQYQHMHSAAEPLRELFASLNVSEFGPLKLAECRDYFRTLHVRRPLRSDGKSKREPCTRTGINQRVQRIKRIFRWGVSQEIVDATTLVALDSLDGLRKGKDAAPETQRKRPVDWIDVSQTLAWLSPQVATMVKVQWLTGMRSAELTLLRACDIDSSDSIWVYAPLQNKNDWRENPPEKLICIGPRAQRLLRRYLPDDPQTFVFQPSVSLAEQSAIRARERCTKHTPSSLAWKRKPRTTNERYDSHAYGAAITRAIKRANHNGLSIPNWSPHLIRHSRATIIRSQYKIEGAQAILGNTLKATEIYAEKSIALAIQIASETG